MRFRIRAWVLSLLIGTVSQAGAVWAHPQKVAITDVFFNPRSGLIEIAHRFSLHDADAALDQLGRGGADLARDPADRDRFAAYVAGHFRLASDAAPGVLDLDHVGHEVEQGYIWVYQQTPIPRGLASLQLQADVFHEIWPNQVNMVNVRRGGQVQSRSLDRDGPTAMVWFYSDDEPAAPPPLGPEQEKDQGHEPT